ncbi:protein AMN1 homolog isoform X2 [Culicoides brevitarsis]|uniref:protein AMN1 homolog isoform X2 n=1 Tax=Culicoides brevitarsis TaxID=469753 RepID=UPI00307CB213
MDDMKKYSVPSLYKTCIRNIASNVTFFKHDKQYLKVLPAHMKNAVIRLVTKIYGGFQDDEILRLMLNSELDDLDLTICKVTDRLLEDLRYCKNLRNLVLPPLNNTDCTKETLCDLIPCLTRLESLHIKDSLIVDDHVVALIARHCKHLDLLNLEKCMAITDDAMLHLREMKLTKLSLAHTNISDTGIIHIENSELENHLEDFNVKYCNISCAGLNHLRWDKIKYIGFEVVDINNFHKIEISNHCPKMMQWTIPFN